MSTLVCPEFAFDQDKATNSVNTLFMNDPRPLTKKSKIGLDLLLSSNSYSLFLLSFFLSLEMEPNECNGFTDVCNLLLEGQLHQ